VLLAGGQGSRLGALTAREAKPAVAFSGDRRIVDFVMSNACESGIDPLIVCTQWHPETLVAHLRRHWAAGFARGLVMRDGAAVAGEVSRHGACRGLKRGRDRRCGHRGCRRAGR
jgi:glucose-1-phosphate adenylyltransferase